MGKTPSELASEFYDIIIDSHHEEFNYEFLQYKEWLDLLSSKLKKGDAILDLGCGNGRAVKYFVDNGFQGIGIDISDKMLDLARKHIPKGKFLKREFSKLDFKPNSIDAVISFFALNHIPKSQFKDVMNSCKNILKKNGFLLLGMVKGNDEGFFKGFYDKDMSLYGAGYTKKEIVDILESTGYEVLKIAVGHFKGKYFEEDDIHVLARIKK